MQEFACFVPARDRQSDGQKDGLALDCDHTTETMLTLSNKKAQLTQRERATAVHV